MKDGKENLRVHRPNPGLAGVFGYKQESINTRRAERCQICILMMRKKQTFKANIFWHLLAKGREGKGKRARENMNEHCLSQTHCSRWLCPLSRAFWCQVLTVPSHRWDHFSTARSQVAYVDMLCWALFTETCTWKNKTMTFCWLNLVLIYHKCPHPRPWYYRVLQRNRTPMVYIQGGLL